MQHLNHHDTDYDEILTTEHTPLFVAPLRRVPQPSNVSTINLPLANRLPDATPSDSAPRNSSTV